MVDIIISDVWASVDLLITCFIVTATVCLNLLFAFRVVYMVKNYEDPIKAFKKYEDKGILEDVLKNQKEYNDINAI
jgi:hypothetical protein